MNENFFSFAKKVWHMWQIFFTSKNIVNQFQKMSSLSTFLVCVWTFVKSPWERERIFYFVLTWLKGFGSRTEGEWPLVMIEDFPELRAQFCLRLWRENQWDGVGRTTQSSTARQNVVFNNNNICNNYESSIVASLLAFHLLKFHQFSKWPTTRRSLCSCRASSAAVKAIKKLLLSNKRAFLRLLNQL